MKNRICLLMILLFSLNSFASDDYMNAKIGIWCESSDGGKTCLGYETFYDDGTFTSVGTDILYDVGYRVRGTWALDGNKACMTVIEYFSYDLITNQEIPPPNIEVLCGEILYLDDEIYKYKTGEGKIETMYRVN